MLPFYSIDIKAASKKWKPLVETLGLNTSTPLGAEKLEWMAEMAEIHTVREQFNKSNALNENVGWVNMNTITGMGPVVSPQPSPIPGMTGTTGSGDLGQNLFNVAMKIAYQTIGLDLVAVKPSPGPRIDLLYMDYRYDDSSLAGGEKEKPQLFQVPAHSALRTHLEAIIANNTNPSGRMFVKFVVTTIGTPTVLGLPHNPAQEGANSPAGNKAIYTTANATAATTATLLGNFDGVTVGEYVEFYAEFIGFSIYNRNAIFRTYRQTNNSTTGTGQGFDPAQNSFPAKMAIATALGAFATGGTYSHVTVLAPSFAAGAGSTQTPIIEGAVVLGAAATGQYNAQVDLVSANEDHVEGFSANWNKLYPMNRAEDEDFNPGTLGVHFFTKTIQTGVVEISAAVKRNEIEDIKATTGIDVVQKLQGQLVNELSQTISKHIVAKVKEMGIANRATAPRLFNGLTGYVPAKQGGYETHFDFNVDRYIGGININAYNGGNGNPYAAPGTGSILPGVSQNVSLTSTNYRENSDSLKRKLIGKIRNASTFILKEGRYGQANYIVTSGNIASIISDGAGYMMNPYTSNVDAQSQLYPAGTLGNITVYVDPYMDYADNSIYLGRKNSVDQPGLVFIPYLMAQELSIMSENTRAPRLFLRSKYAVAEIGFYPEKQFMAMYVQDSNNILL